MKNATLIPTVFLLATLVTGGQQGKTIPTAKEFPTLGFAYIKDVPPIIDADALEEEHELGKKLPGNAFVKDRRTMHEASMMHEFVEGFQNSKECTAITLQMGESKKSQFIVQISVNGHDNKPNDQTWTWMLFWPSDPSPADSKSHGMAGLGAQASAKLTARDVCLTLWDDVEPNHFKKPGGKIER
jgi:hypothetical protein